MTPEIKISTEAAAFFVELIAKQAMPLLGVRLTVVHAGTPSADVKLAFCDEDDVRPTDVHVPMEGFGLYIEAASAPYLDRATIHYASSNLGSQLEIKAPEIKGKPPSGDAAIVEQVQFLLSSEINPSVAQHGGLVTLVEVTDGAIVVLKFGGGCHGCGMKDVTLKQGIEKTLLERIPAVKGVRDITDHSTGANPYFKA
jgi:Fe/S biogenesis protein NfuA